MSSDPALLGWLCMHYRSWLVWGRAPAPDHAERTGAPVKPGVGLTGWRSSAAASDHSNSGFAIAVIALVSLGLISTAQTQSKLRNEPARIA